MVMLILSRKVGESIVIPEFFVTVTLLAVKGNSFRLGIAAPPELAIQREEVLQRIGAEACDPDRVPPTS